VSEIGYGAWGIGKSSWIGARDDESLKALHRSVDLGLNFIDTALVYGNGHSETLEKLKIHRWIRNFYQ
jgi:aryl-alcohol dehydrogenase-like predicted oxidoreductase